MQNIPKILKRIASTNSIIEKKKILTETRSDDFETIFKLAYDPFITYGTVKIKIDDLIYDEKREVNKDWLMDLTSILHLLENRKLTGNAARDNIRDFINHYPKEWSEVVLNILKKDLRIGVSKKIINSVYDNLLPSDICMSAMKYNEKRVSFPVWVDTKLDGIRCIANINKTIKLFSRNGKEFVNYPTIAEELKKLELQEGIRVDGEIMSSHFQELMRTVSRKEGGIELAKDVVYNIFDVIMEKTVFERRIHELDVIKNKIKKLNLKHLKVVEGKLIYSREQLQNFYEECIASGNEGVMIKSLNEYYEFKRSYSWQKMKPTETIDVKIIDFEEGTGKYKGSLGAFVCLLPNKKNIQVGSGLIDSERDEYWKKKNELIGQTIEIKFQEWTANKQSIRFPVFLRLRPDKNK